MSENVPENTQINLIALDKELFQAKSIDWPVRESRQSLNKALDFYLW